jgi:hypothetical protein
VVDLAECVVFWKIGHGKVVVMKAWRTHERQRVGGSQRSEGHGYSKVECNLTVHVRKVHGISMEPHSGSWEIRLGQVPLNVLLPCYQEICLIAPVSPFRPHDRHTLFPYCSHTCVMPSPASPRL